MSVGGDKKSPESPEKMLASLPSDVMVRVNEFLHLHERIHFASSSKKLQKLIYQDCTPLWREIDFSSINWEAKRLLTDERLSSLLTRVNARTVMKSLNLDGCGKLVGSGIEPLRNSKVLEAISLRSLPFVQNLRPDIIIPILRTMIPFQLKHVCFRETYDTTLMDKGPREFTDFLRDLRAARLEDARHGEIPCSACKMAVSKPSLQLVPTVCGLPSFSCGGCTKSFCRHTSCPTALNDCAFCGDVSCDTCASVFQCDSCHLKQCEPCGNERSCDSCSKHLCAECFYENEGESCEGCDRNLCGECAVGQRDEEIVTCDQCLETWCTSCREVQFCNRCQQSYCTHCAKFNFFVCSQDYACEHCEAPYTCDQCDTTNCIECVSTCSVCQKKSCESCTNVELCGGCEELVCEDCECCSDGRSSAYNGRPSKRARTSK